jgi:hypothetical protein
MLLRLFGGMVLVNILALAYGTSGLQEGSNMATPLTRDRRDVCKYTKGDWSTCNPLTKLEMRQDTVKPGQSSPDCPQSRTITRNCNKDKSLKPNSFKKGLCVYAKARDQDWSECKSGVRQKLLKLLSSQPAAGCPNIKVISKKCKNKKPKKDEKIVGKKTKSEKKKERKEKKEAKLKKKQEKIENKITEKCDFGEWSDFTECADHKKSRTRKITRGADMKLCRKQTTHIQQC